MIDRLRVFFFDVKLKLSVIASFGTFWCFFTGKKIEKKPFHANFLEFFHAHFFFHGHFFRFFSRVQNSVSRVWIWFFFSRFTGQKYLFFHGLKFRFHGWNFIKFSRAEYFFHVHFHRVFSKFSRVPFFHGHIFCFFSRANLFFSRGKKKHWSVVGGVLLFGFSNLLIIIWYIH